MSTTRSLSEIVTKVCELQTRDEKVAWLKENNSLALRTILAVIYDPDTYKWAIPQTPPPYKPSPHVESHGMLYRQVRKLRYFIKGFDGDNLDQYRREYLFIEMLESVDADDAKLLIKVLQQKPLSGLDRDVIVEALGAIIPVVAAPAKEVTTVKKRGRPRKND